MASMGRTHFYGDGCDAEHGAPCAHDSMDGIDQAPFGPDKVWKCCMCGEVGTEEWLAYKTKNPSPPRRVTPYPAETGRP